jgi:hypothetical protein
METQSSLLKCFSTTILEVAISVLCLLVSRLIFFMIALGNPSACAV